MFNQTKDKSFNEIIAECGEPIDTIVNGLIKREYVATNVVVRTEWIVPIQALETISDQIAQKQEEISQLQEQATEIKAKKAEIEATAIVEPKEEPVPVEPITEPI